MAKLEEEEALLRGFGIHLSEKTDLNAYLDSM
jgi:hypothetical protein